MDSNGVFKMEDIKAKPISIKMDNGNPLITLTWENVNVHTPGKQPRNLLLFKTKGIQSKHIVKHVTGIAKPGTLTVIMGASGSGKSTFLNALNFRHRGDLKVTGDVKINGSVVKSREALASLSGYVQQDDLFVGTLNVGEQLKFQAFLRMSKSTSKQEKLDRVEELLNDLNLKKCEHTTIGIPDKCVKGISGGEKRRLAFACELITNPNLLFFDEPTSGLDSFMAMTIVETMRHLTEKGKTIVCTMHQPSSELFSRFDRLLLMAEGRLAFLGDIHDSNNFFKSLGYDCPYNYNPADFIIKTLAIEPSNRQTSLDRINKICDGFEKSVFMKDLMVDVKNADNLATNPLTTVKLVNKINYNVNYLVQFVWLLWRELLANSRNPFTIRIAISQTLIVSLLLGLIFLRVNYDQVGVQNINGVLFLILTNLSFTSMFAVINNFPSQIHIFMREHQNGMYSVISYYFSKILADLPRFIILPFVMVTIIYWMSNCNNNVGRFFICVFIIIVSVNVAVSFGTFISALAPNPKIAINLNAPLLVPLMIFSGYFINSATIPVYFIWLKYLSWWSYAFELLVINQWQGISGIECSNDTISNCYHNGNDVIHDLSFTRADYPLNWIALFILFFGWKILAFVVLFLKSLKK